jgi:uncharacterized membrane protein (DUF106 family)
MNMRIANVVFIYSDQIIYLFIYLLQLLFYKSVQNHQKGIFFLTVNTAQYSTFAAHFIGECVCAYFCWETLTIALLKNFLFCILSFIFYYFVCRKESFCT